MAASASLATRGGGLHQRPSASAVSWSARARRERTPLVRGSALQRAAHPFDGYCDPRDQV
eukprot:6504-Heterococcus_DN1.PRE.1